MFKWSLVLALFILCSKSYSQKQGKELIDSLAFQLKNYKSKCDQPCLADSSKITLLNTLAIQYQNLNPDSTMLFSNEALKISEKIGWNMGLGQSNIILGNVLQSRGDYSNAVDHFNKAIKVYQDLLFKENNSKLYLEKLCAAEGSLANTLRKMGNYTDALNYYFNINTIYEKLSLKNESANALGNIAVININLKDYNRSIEYSKRAMKMNEELNDEMGVSRNCINLGICYKELKQFDQSLFYSFKALDILRKNNDHFEIAKYMSNIASTYQEMENDKKALDYAFQALKLDSEYNNIEGMAVRYVLIGNSYLNLYEFPTAEKYFKKALSISDSIKNADVSLKAIKNLRVLYAYMGKYKEAFIYLTKEKAIEDSTFSKEQYQQLTRLEMQYAFNKQQDSIKVVQEKREAESKAELSHQKLLRNTVSGGAAIIILSFIFSFFFYKRKRDAEQRQKEMALSLQVSETEMKALRSQMNPHFIFNALQSIQTFLMSHQSEEANIYLLKFSKLMRAVLENSQHREISLQKDMQALELYMQLESIRLPHPFTYTFHIDESVDMEETTIPPLILQPFIENAIWHGLQYKAEPGHINIYISKKDNALYATVEDNGVGRDMSKQVQQPMLLQKESLGMKLTEERLKILNELKKIKAQFKITDLFDKDNTPAGTKIELSLPF